MSKDRGEFTDATYQSNPTVFQDEIWTDDNVAQLYGNRGIDDQFSWRKFIDGNPNLELIESKKEIEFTNRLYDAFNKALKEGKPLIVEFTQENCNFCKKLENETFKSEDVKALRDRAIWVRVDQKTDEDDKGNVAQLAADLGINRYPTTVALELTPTSIKELGRMVGFFNGKQFAENMNQILPPKKEKSAQALAAAA